MAKNMEPGMEKQRSEFSGRNEAAGSRTTAARSAGASRQARLGTKKFLQFLYCRIQDDEVPAIGAQLTYYLILAFFPFLIFVIAVLSFSNLTAADAITSMTRILPEVSNQTILKAFEEIQKSRNGPMLSLGLFIALWSASNGVNAVIKALNKAYDEEEDRPFWKVRGISILFTIILAAVILLSFLMLIFGRQIGAVLYRLFLLPGSFDAVWGLAQYAVPLAAMATVFILLYRYTPNLRLTFKEVVPGALFAALGWIVTSLLFSFYVNHFGNYTKTYGSIGGIIVLLTWLYLSSIIIVMGGEINATLHFDRTGKNKPACKSFAFKLPFGRKNHA